MFLKCSMVHFFLVTSDTRTSQNLKPLKTCHPDETPTRNGVRCSAKRKLIDETQTLQNKQIKVW